MLDRSDFLNRDMHFNLEIDFYQQNEAAVFLESNCAGMEEKFGELLLFCTVAVRTLINFGKDNPIALDLAAFLEVLSKGSHLTSPDLPDLFKLKLVDYPSVPGRRRFIARLKVSKGRIKFKYHAKGFGLFGRGVEYYAPAAVLLFLFFLARKRKDDSQFIEALKKAIVMCAKAYVANTLNLVNQLNVASDIALTAFVSAFFEESSVV